MVLLTFTYGFLNESFLVLLTNGSLNKSLLVLLTYCSLNETFFSIVDMYTCGSFDRSIFI